MKNDIEPLISFKIFFLIVLVVGGIVFASSILNTMEKSEKRNIEAEWVNNAECKQLQQFIIETIDGTDYHFGLGNKAKELYQWKCGI